LIYAYESLKGNAEIIKMMLWYKALWTTPERQKANCTILHFLLDRWGALIDLELIPNNLCHHPG
jgi:hypothetical protein